MNRASELRKISKIGREVEAMLEEKGVDFQIASTPKAAKAIKGRHPRLYLWLIVHAVVKAIHSQPTVTKEQLEEVDGVGPVAAQRIVDHINGGQD